MTEREPVSTVEDLDTLDSDEITEGYVDALNGFPCGDNRSRAYWHGWRNGMVDCGHAKIDAAMRQLVHAHVNRSRTLPGRNGR